MLILTLIGCGGTETIEYIKSNGPSGGWVDVRIDGSPVMEESLRNWQGLVRARHVLDQATVGVEELQMEVRLGMVSSDLTDGVGLHLFLPDLSEPLSGSVVLDPRSVSGDRSHLGVTMGGDDLVSDGGIVVFSTFEAGEVAGTITTTLVQPGGSGGGVDAEVTFEGPLVAGCSWYDFEANDGSIVDVGLDDPGCAALFE